MANHAFMEKLVTVLWAVKSAYDEKRFKDAADAIRNAHSLLAKATSDGGMSDETKNHFAAYLEGWSLQVILNLAIR